MSATAKPSMIISDPTKGVTGKSAIVSAPPSPAIALPYVKITVMYRRIGMPISAAVWRSARLARSARP